jgi:hypothetical protein
VTSRMLPLVLVVALVSLSACAPSLPPPSVSAPTGPPVGAVRRLAVVASGPSTLTMPGPAPSTADSANVARIFGEIAKWYPKAAWMGPLAVLVQRGVDWLFEDGRSSAADRHARGVAPGAVVAEAFTRTLLTSKQFDQVRTLGREPLGEERREIDALVRIIVPAWGLVRVREGAPEMMAAFADTRAQVVVAPTSAVIWEHAEDVTHGERLPLQTYTGDSELTRQALMDVLERAGQRLANELLYAQGAR